MTMTFEAIEFDNAGEAIQHYYASGYYAAAKRQRLEHIRQPQPVLASAPWIDAVQNTADANARQFPKK